MERRDPDAKLGKTCTCRASIGSSGSGISAVWVDFISPPLGKRTEMLGDAGSLLVHGAFMSKKCPVAPVSAMMGELFIGGEGASCE